MKIKTERVMLILSLTFGIFLTSYCVRGRLHNREDAPTCKDEVEVVVPQPQVNPVNEQQLQTAKV